jgi:hypothetical protein
VEGKGRVEPRQHCDVMVQSRSSKSLVLQPSTLEAMYWTLSRKHYGSLSTRTARAIHNELLVSHAEDARITMTDITFEGGKS